MSQLHNPYAAPQANVAVPREAEAMASVRLQDASKGQRFLNLILDSILCNVLAMIGGAILGGILGATGKTDAAGAVGAVIGFGFLGEPGSGLHDKIAKTRVVRQ